MLRRLTVVRADRLLAWCRRAEPASLDVDVATGWRCQVRRMWAIRMPLRPDER